MVEIIHSATVTVTQMENKAVLAVNEPRTLKAVVPTYLDTGKKYRLMVVTQSSAKGHGYLVKEVRQMRSDFVLTAQ